MLIWYDLNIFLLYLYTIGMEQNFCYFAKDTYLLSEGHFSLFKRKTVVQNKLFYLFN